LNLLFIGNVFSIELPHNVANSGLRSVMKYALLPTYSA